MTRDLPGFASVTPDPVISLTALRGARSLASHMRKHSVPMRKLVSFSYTATFSTREFVHVYVGITENLAKIIVILLIDH